MKILRKLAIACCVAALAAAPATCIIAQAADDSATQKDTTAKKRVTPVDINSATSEELQTLKGIDSDTADKIISGRTYKSITELVSKGILTKDAYNAIRSEIIAKKPAADSSSNKKSNKKGNNNNRGKPGKGRR